MTQTMETPTKELTVNELTERYEITRKPLYRRKDALKIEFAKNRDGRAYATPEQIKLLDQLHEHVKRGGNLATFVPEASVVAPDTARDTAAKQRQTNNYRGDTASDTGDNTG